MRFPNRGVLTEGSSSHWLVAPRSLWPWPLVWPLASPDRNVNSQIGLDLGYQGLLPSLRFVAIFGCWTTLKLWPSLELFCFGWELVPCYLIRKLHENHQTCNSFNERLIQQRPPPDFLKVDLQLWNPQKTLETQTNSCTVATNRPGGDLSNEI